MSDQSCSPGRIDAIAAQLNEGNRAASNRLINECTLSLPGATAYFNDFRQNGEAILNGDPAATRRSEGIFNELARQERAVWTAIRDAANSRNPEGLCKLEIVEDQQMGPRINLAGDRCN
ncbi:MAG: hypothetical protein K2Y39_04275 [Candidatus Obscuribacterales bacterium]|nr:hypothetical protein [Candidatus Obscuribacterales bacterium]